MRGGRCWRMVGGCGERIRGPDRALRSSAPRRRRVCGFRGMGWHECAGCGSREGAARSGWCVKGYAGSLEWRLSTGVDGSGGKGRVGSRLGGALRLDRLRVWIFDLGLCGWLVVWCVCWRRVGGFGRRLGVRCGRAGVRLPLEGGLWCVQAVRGPSPTSCFAGRFLRGRACLLGGGGLRGGMRRGCCEDTRAGVKQCGAGGLGLRALRLDRLRVWGLGLCGWLVVWCMCWRRVGGSNQ